MLFKNLVIGVTSFFRDPEAYDVLAEQVLPACCVKKSPGMIRFWVAGCSTGEEAYSLAILLCEAMDRLKKHVNVQIFATDIDATALEVARKGVYPDSIAADVSQERLSRFFTKETGFFKIKKQLRDMVVFSLQNIIKDPPFSRLDLVSCRNLMIYMDTVLQKKIIPLFHYTLNPGGILFLGTSETIGEHTDFFKPINSKWKIFERIKGPADRLCVFHRNRYGPGREPNPMRKTTLPEAGAIQAMAEKAILEEYAPAGVLINDNYEILHFVGKTERYLVPPTGKPSFNILNMARKDLKHQLTTALHKAVREKRTLPARRVASNHNGSFYLVDMIR